MFGINRKKVMLVNRFASQKIFDMLYINMMTLIKVKAETPADRQVRQYKYIDTRDMFGHGRSFVLGKFF